ncbi:ComEC/Rec2 family competence protein [Litoribacillus peritrichatus]|uniref:ComEC/Rec2-related protein domain-containing protein n=1 Tax=Litoribacillus peritrichatus TaxID=718191 RepID=A0ABP7N3R1_9GAMM
MQGQELTWIHFLAISGAVVAMLMGIILTFYRLHVLEQNFSANSIKALGVLVFLPSLVIFAVLTNFGSETLAALLGTVAGYVLSSSERDS